jgi:thymidylate kinase
MNKPIDLVIAGPDFSGTTTQITDSIRYFRNKNMVVKDLRGTEIDALFHSEELTNELHRTGHAAEFVMNLNQYLETVDEWIRHGVTTMDPASFFFYVNKLLSGGGTSQDLRVASMVKNDITTYINPNSADVWIMEEPTRRGAGQVCRVIEQNRSKFGSHMDGISAALSHQAYRTEEFLRFRGPLRDAGKIIVRSRSEESACYQVYDKKSLRSGITIDDYLKLPGHKIAFANPPTHIFVVCGPVDWDKDEYLKLKAERTGSRILDDHESNYSYQLLVNQRYATDWLENLYHKGCAMYGSKEPMIVKFDIYNNKEVTREHMNQALDGLLLANFLEKFSGK